MIVPEGDEWLPTAEAAAQTGVPAGTIGVWVHRGRVRSHRVGRQRWVLVDDVLEAAAPTPATAQAPLRASARDTAAPT